MTRVLLLAFVGLGVAGAACTAPPGEGDVGTTRDGIAGGQVDGATLAVGFLVERTSDGSTVEPACTATLVARHTVVTSAQCVATKGSSFTAVFDKQRRGVKAVHVQPAFDPEDLENGNDVAVLVLDAPVDGIAPARLGEGTEGASRIVGHGRNSGAEGSAHERRSLASSDVFVDQAMIRASTAGGAVCTADAGAALVHDKGSAVELVATLSFAESDSDDGPMCSGPVVAVLTSLMPHLPFIRGIAKEAGDDVTTASGPSSPAPVGRTDVPLVFDASFYGDLNGDLSAAFGHDAVALGNHWITYGHREARIATAVFDVGYYLAHEPDVAAQTGGDRGAAILHFVDHGAVEGRRGSAVFDARWYAAHHPDLAVFRDDAGALANHYMTYGMLEGRQASADFEPRWFAANIPAVRDVYGPTNFRAAVMYFLQHQNDGIRGVP